MDKVYFFIRVFLIEFYRIIIKPVCPFLHITGYSEYLLSGSLPISFLHIFFHQIIYFHLRWLNQVIAMFLYYSKYFNKFLLFNFFPDVFSIISNKVRDYQLFYYFEHLLNVIIFYFSEVVSILSFSHVQTSMIIKAWIVNQRWEI